MRLGIFSDSHGDAAALRWAMEQAIKLGPLDDFIFLGDGAEEFEEQRDFMRRLNPNAICYQVRGNNDFSATVPYELVTPFHGVKLLLVHGHTMRVRYGDYFLTSAARERGCQGVLYGHTHISRMEYKDGILLVNPGSISLPRRGGPSCAVLTIEKDQALRPEIIYL